MIDVQSKFEPDPNDMTAASMQTLIHAVNSSLHWGQMPRFLRGNGSKIAFFGQKFPFLPAVAVHFALVLFPDVDPDFIA